MSPSPIDYLYHIYNECVFLKKLFEKNTFESFSSDRTIMYASCRSLEIIGEDKKKVPDAFRITYPLVEWKKIVRVRDKIIHDYFGFDCEVFCETIKTKNPPLTESIEVIIEKKI